MKAYFISGMAADARVFRHIRLPEGYEPVYLDWIDPVPHESLRSYALRLAERIDRNHPFILLGLSFGGMLGTEIAKKFKPALTILISSIPVSSQLPGYYRMAKKMRLHQLVPISVLKSGAIVKRFFTKESPDNKKLLAQVIRESDPRLIRWSMEAILGWENDEVPEPICHIHGTRDEILPIRYTHPTHTVENGSHMMVLEQATRINEILHKVLQPVMQC